MNLNEVNNTISQFRDQYSEIKQKGQELIKALNKEFTKEPISKLISDVVLSDFMLTFNFLGKTFYAETVILPEKPLKLKSDGAMVTYTKTKLGSIDKTFLICTYDRPGNFFVEGGAFTLEEFIFVYFMKLYSAVRFHIAANDSGSEFIPLSAI